MSWLSSALGGLGKGIGKIGKSLGGLAPMLSFIPGMQGLAPWMGALGALSKGGKMNFGDILGLLTSGPLKIPGLKIPGLDPKLIGANGEVNFGKFQPKDWLAFMGTEQGKQILGAVTGGGGSMGSMAGMPASVANLQNQLYQNLGKVFGEQWKAYASRDWAKYEADLLKNATEGIDQEFDAQFANFKGNDERPGKEDTERGVAQGVMAFNKAKAVTDAKSNIPRQVMSERFSYLSPMMQGMTGALSPMALIDRSLYDRQMQDFTDSAYFLGMPGFGQGAGSGSTGGQPGQPPRGPGGWRLPVDGPSSKSGDIWRELEKFKKARFR